MVAGGGLYVVVNPPGLAGVWLGRVVEHPAEGEDEALIAVGWRADCWGTHGLNDSEIVGGDMANDGVRIGNRSFLLGGGGGSGMVLWWLSNKILLLKYDSWVDHAADRHTVFLEHKQT